MVEQKSPFDRKIAVIIGINSYQNGINSLKTAVPDAEAIADRLKTKQGYEIFPEVILDAAATCDRLKTLLKEELPQHIGKGDRVLFYFAGHGVALDGRDGPEGYMVPQNAKPGDKGSMLPMQMLHDALGKLDCRHLLLILDCCFAGAFRWSANYRDVGLEEDLNEQRYQYFIQQPAWQIITSAGSDERAIDVLALSDQRGQVGSHSPFAQVLLDGLAGKADRYPAAKNGAPAGDGVITANELITYIESEFSERLQDQALNQTPGLWCFRKHGNGRYIFDHPDHPRNLKHAPPLDESTNPYRGLQAFEREDKDLFFGRSELTAKLTKFVKQRPLTVVLGTSGAGKSSLVKAGLIPHIEALQNGQRWAILPFRPENSPFAALNQVLSERGLPPIKNPLQSKATDPSLEEALSGWLQAHPDMQLLVVIDQFEELVTLSGGKERQLFLEALATAIVKYARQLHLVITLRSDFEPQFKDSPLAPFWNNDNFFVTTPMSRADLRQAIEKPAAKRTFFFESDDPEHSLVDRLINEVEGMPGALPLLSFALSELYLKYLGRQEAARKQGLPPIDRAITEADYQALGSVQQSITKRADEIYDNLRQCNGSKAVLEKVRQTFRESSDIDEKSADRQIQQICQSGVSDRVIRNVMLRMVSTTGVSRSRRPVQCSELAYPEPDCIQVAIVLETFEQERLLTTDQDAAGNPYIEPAHDALILNWSKINLWLNERQDKVETKKQFAPLVALKASLLKLTRPASSKVPEAVKLTNNGSEAHRAENGKEGASESERSKPSNNGSDTPLKVNLQLQRDLTNATDKWDSARKGNPVEQNGQDPNEDEPGDKGKNKKPWVLPPKRVAEWLWNNDPRLRSVEQISQSADNWLNSIETMFVSESTKRRDRNSQVFWLATIVIGSGLVAGLVFSLIGQRDAKIRQIEALINSSKANFTAGQEFDALLDSLRATKQLQNLQQPQNLLLDLLLGKPNLEKFDLTQALQQAVYGVREFNRLKGDPRKGEGTPLYWGIDGQVSWHPDGQTLAYASGAQTVTLSRQDGTKLQTLEGFSSVTGVSWSPDGKTLATVSKDGTVKLWKSDGTLRESFKVVDGGECLGINWSPDGERLAMPCNSGIQLRKRDGTFEINNFQKNNNFQKKTLSVSWHPDGQILASGGSEGIRLWNRDGTPIPSSKDFPSSKNYGVWIYGTSWNPDGQILAIAVDSKQVKLLRRSDLKELATVESKGVQVLSWTPDGKTLATAGGQERTVKLWQWDDGKLLPIATFRSPTPIVSLKWSPDGQTLATLDRGDGTVRLWKRNNPLRLTLSHSQGVNDASLSPDGKTLATTGEDTTVKLWTKEGALFKFDKTLFKFDKTLNGCRGSVQSVSWSLGGQFLAAGDCSSVKLWMKDSRLTTLLGRSNNVYSVSWSPDWALAYGAGDKTVELLKLGGGKVRMRPFPDEIKGVNWSPDGQILAVTVKDDSVFLQKPDGSRLKKLENLGNKAVSWSPDGQFLAISGGNTINLWKRDGTEQKPITTESEGVGRIAWHPKGKILAAASQDMIELWKLDGSAWTKLTTLKGHTDVLNSLSWSFDGKTLISASNDQTVKLWQLDDDLDNQRLDGLQEESLREKACNWIRGYLENIPDDNLKNIPWIGDYLKNSLPDYLKNIPWVGDYLKNNPDFSESDRHLCDGIPSFQPNNSALVASPTSPVPASPSQNQPPPSVTAVNSFSAPSSPNGLPSASSATPTSSPQLLPRLPPPGDYRGEIRFDRGATSAQLISNLKPQGTDPYTFTADAGQIAKFTIYVTKGGQASLRLLNPQGNPLPQFIKPHPIDGSPISVKLPTSGTYIMEIVNQQAAIAAYTLKLEIKPKS